MLLGGLASSYQSGIFHVRAITIFRSEHFVMFCGIFIFHIIVILFLIYLFLFHELKFKGPKYDHNGNINKDS